MEKDDVKAVSKAIIVDHKNRILLLKPANKARWHLPGGHLKRNERYAVGMRREVLEETGLKIVRSTVTNQSHAGFQLFICKAHHNVVRLSKEHEDYKWVSLSEAIKKIDLTSETLRNLKKLRADIHKYAQFIRPEDIQIKPEQKEKSDEDTEADADKSKDSVEITKHKD